MGDRARTGMRLRRDVGGGDEALEARGNAGGVVSAGGAGGVDVAELAGVIGVGVAVVMTDS